MKKAGIRLFPDTMMSEANSLFDSTFGHTRSY